MKHFVVLLLLFPALLRAGELLRLEDSTDAMGTTYTVILYGEDEQQLQETAEAAFSEVRRLDRMLSNYRPQSEWRQMNLNAPKGPVKVSQELFDLLQACVSYNVRSKGTFDIGVGPLMRVWGFYKGTGRLPMKAEIAAVLPAVGSKNIELDPKTRTVRFLRRGVELDPGGIGKGYAVDHMVATIKEHNITSALVSAGGSTIYGLGTPPGDEGWKVKIRNPRKWTETIQDVYLKDRSMSTSGDYEKFFEAEGKIYSHIMDPRTGYPAPGMLSVSVVAPKAIDSEAWTKPFFILGRDWTAKHKPQGLRVYMCEDRSDLACVWLQ
ncbi:MAG: FAD:protein FMN transferase [Bryobacteraceae bacterium]